MKLVTQYNNLACFPACLESFLADQGRTITQTDIVTDFPQYHSVGEKDEGCFGFSASRLKDLGQKYKFSFDILSQLSHPITLDEKEAIFMAALECGTDKTQHCVRFIRYLVLTSEIEIMNPSRNAPFPDKWAVLDANKWKCILLKLRAV